MIAENAAGFTHSGFSKRLEAKIKKAFQGYR